MGQVFREKRTAPAKTELRSHWVGRVVRSCVLEGGADGCVGLTWKHLECRGSCPVEQRLKL